MSVAPDYKVLVRAFADTSTYGPGPIIAEFQNVKNLGWSEYLNDIGDCFFTINQDDPKIKKVRLYMKGNAHVEVYRNGSKVWAGWLLEADENQEDVVFTAYSYLAGLYWLHSDWAQEWTGAQIDTIFSDLWTRATTTLTDTPMAWMTSAGFEAPVTTSGGATPMIQAYYKVYRKRILLIWKELAAMATSDTTNAVCFEITPSGVVALYKARGQQRTTPVWEYPSQSVIGFRRIRNMADRRNVLYGVGSSPKAAVLQSQQIDSSDRDTYSRKEEAIYYAWVRDQTELDRVTKHRLGRAKRDDNVTMLSFAPNQLIPFRGSGAEFTLSDRVRVRIVRGLTNIAGYKMITGQQVILNRGNEYVRVFVQDTL